MKTIQLVAAIGLVLLFQACAQTDDKNEKQGYPNYDTTKPMEHINDPDTASEGVSLPNKGLSSDQG